MCLPSGDTQLKSLLLCLLVSLWASPALLTRSPWRANPTACVSLSTAPSEHSGGMCGISQRPNTGLEQAAHCPHAQGLPARRRLLADSVWASDLRVHKTRGPGSYRPSSAICPACSSHSPLQACTVPTHPGQLGLLTCHSSVQFLGSPLPVASLTAWVATTLSPVLAKEGWSGGARPPATSTGEQCLLPHLTAAGQVPQPCPDKSLCSCRRPEIRASRGL